MILFIFYLIMFDIIEDRNADITYKKKIINRLETRAYIIQKSMKKLRDDNIYKNS